METTAAQAATWATPPKSKDKVFVLMLVGAGLGGLWLSLQSAGYLLAFNVNTLLIACVIFTLTSANYIIHAKDWRMQVQYAALALVPITLRFALNLPFFQSYTASLADWAGQALFALQVLALWCVVAVCEEAFRATCMNVWDAIYQVRNKKSNTLLKILFANALWILFHFIQRPFDIWTYRYYIVWLFCSGLVLGFLVEKAGLGSAALAHFIVNVTA